MKEVKSIVFHYHDKTYELVKLDYGTGADWRVYLQTLEGRGEIVDGFSDARFNPEQAMHMAMHKLSAYALGLKEGQMRKQRFGATG